MRDGHQAPVTAFEGIAQKHPAFRIVNASG